MEIHSRSSVRFRLKPDTSNSHEFELHRPSKKGTKLLLKVIKAIIIIRNFGIKTVFLSALASADSCGNLQSWDFSRPHAAYILRFLQNCCCTFWMQSHVSTAWWALSGQEWIFFLEGTSFDSYFELSAKLRDYFSWSNKSNVDQSESATLRIWMFNITLQRKIKSYPWYFFFTERLVRSYVQYASNAEENV